MGDLTDLIYDGDCAVGADLNDTRLGQIYLPRSTCCDGGRLQITVTGTKRVLEDPAIPGNFHATTPVILLGEVSGTIVSVVVSTEPSGFPSGFGATFQVSVSSVGSPLAVGVLEVEIDEIEFDASTWTMIIAWSAAGEFRVGFQNGVYGTHVLRITNLSDFYWTRYPLEFPASSLLFESDVLLGYAAASPVSAFSSGCGVLAGGTPLPLIGA